MCQSVHAEFGARRGRGRASAGLRAEVREQVVQHRFLLDPDTALGTTDGGNTVRGGRPHSRTSRAAGQGVNTKTKRIARQMHGRAGFTRQGR
ncbi:hypothetical protein C4J65_27130 [Streptomyces sp. CB09001]|nr:hypothetical protein C4J65_27130 [Streptomyces sp. CB09001]